MRPIGSNGPSLSAAGRSFTASPVATENHVFLAEGLGTVSCIDAAAGETVWRKEFDDGFYASPIIAGSKVYLMDRKGTMHILEAGPGYREIGSPALGEPSVATPALLDGILVVRGEKHLFCIDGGANE